jgi:hypothetical protein
LRADLEIPRHPLVYRHDVVPGIYEDHIEGKCIKKLLDWSLCTRHGNFHPFFVPPFVPGACPRIRRGQAHSTATSLLNLGLFIRYKDLIRIRYKVRFFQKGLREKYGYGPERPPNLHRCRGDLLAWISGTFQLLTNIEEKRQP